MHSVFMSFSLKYSFLIFAILLAARVFVKPIIIQMDSPSANSKELS